ncbi:hypothetical protein [Altererythrobacter sp. GH1-8]|uniref:hypothetical protein n=1 Tax=Altererythrobacter sp. GH1-8 TaxID=3349333 RepID=UPI00374CF249
MASHANTVAALREQPLSLGAWKASLERPLTQFLMLMLAAWLLRAATFGHPNFFLDEAFYFAAGIEMSHGAVPFVDIWDRKPWGHFALFAGFAAISHDPAVYQIAATIFAAATAFFIARLALSVSSSWAAVASGLAYLLLLPIFSGAGGQSPVFYNAFVAAAALLVWKGREGGGWQTPFAMLLAGAAIAIKTSVVFEAIALGLVAVWFCWQRHGPSTRVLERAIFWAIIGAAPSLIIALGYWMSGYWMEFWQAMALSNLDKAYGLASSWERAVTMATRIAPIALLAAVSWAHWRGRREAVLLLAWLLAAVAGLIAIPNFYAHYALPLLMPLCVLAAPFFARMPIGPIAIGTLTVMSLWMAPANSQDQTRKAQSALAELAYAAEMHGAERGLLNYDGPMMLHAATGTRPLTPLMFGPHLSHAPEANVSHLNTTAEIARVLSLKPGVIVMAPEERHLPSNRETRAMVLAYIAANCREVAMVSMPMRYRADDIAVYGDCAAR